MEKIHQKAWWRNENERNANIEDRKISWLELFYDLVYVIAISRTTHHLSLHLDVSGFLDYFYILALIYWGWVNGSWHHDILGANDVRTIFLTIWQIVILSALIVTFNLPSDETYFNATIVVLIMQFYITYLWWSEGIYDKKNRHLNRYYTIAYLFAFALIFTTFFLQQPYARLVFYATLLINYSPPHFANKALGESRLTYRLSASMTERLGLFTIIIFGEVILGVINGMSEFKSLTFDHWVLFIICIFIVFTLWFVFFKLIGDKKVQIGFIKTNVYAVLFLPMAMSLGLISVAFDKLFIADTEVSAGGGMSMKVFLGGAICLFLIATFCIYKLVEMPKLYSDIKPKMQKLLLLVIMGVVFICIMAQYLNLFCFLTLLLSVLLIVPVTILMFWNNLELKKS